MGGSAGEASEGSAQKLKGAKLSSFRFQILELVKRPIQLYKRTVCLYKYYVCMYVCMYVCIYIRICRICITYYNSCQSKTAPQGMYKLLY